MDIMGKVEFMVISYDMPGAVSRHFLSQKNARLGPLPAVRLTMKKSIVC